MEGSSASRRGRCTGRRVRGHDGTVSGGQPAQPPCLDGRGLPPAAEVADGPEPAAAWRAGTEAAPPPRCSLATPGAPLFAHGREHLANIGSQEVIHLVALETAARR